MTTLLVTGIVLTVLVIVALIVLVIVAAWKIFRKAGKPGWGIFVPVYKEILLLEMVNKPYWWIILFFIPVVNLFVLVIVLRRLAATFGKGVGFTVGMIFLPFIFYPILGFGKAMYVNNYPPAKPMSETVKWTLIGLAFFLLMESFFMGGFWSRWHDKDDNTMHTLQEQGTNSETGMY